MAPSAGKMVSKDLLKEQFSILGVDAGDDVLSRCEEICLANSVGEEELVETWMAYSVSNLEGQDPTLETLNQMERSEFSKRNRETPKSTKCSSKSNLVIYNASTISEVNDTFDADILSAYGATPKTKGKFDRRLKKTPDCHRSPRAVFSPASFSPTVSTPASTYESRSNSGRIISSFGNVESSSWKSKSTYSPTFEVISSVAENVNYMFDILRERGLVLDRRVEEIAEIILSKHNLTETKEINALHNEEFVSYGSICCGPQLDHLKRDEIYIQGSGDLSDGCILPLNLNAVPEYAVFPGQVVAIKATNPSRTELIAHDLLGDGIPSLPEKPPSIPLSHGPLQIVIASGPYTQLDTMTYQPLSDLLEYIIENKPHIVILTGPFIDSEHPHVQESLLAETFEKFFEKQVETIMEPLERLHTQVVLVSSSRDVHHQPVFPTPAYTAVKKYPNLHLMGDPCLFAVDGLVIGVTSVDILRHIGSEEITHPPYSKDRLGRLASHVLMQGNFYPLYPPSKTIKLDAKLWELYAHMSVLPHILVLPSDLHAFIKVIHNCVVVNPEHLSKGIAGGTFARLEIPSLDQWKPTEICGQVTKI